MGWRKLIVVVLVLSLVPVLSGCAVLELLATGTTSGIEQGKSSAEWARQLQLAAVATAKQADADKLGAEARIAQAKNEAMAESHSFALAEAEITSRLQSTQMFYLAQTQLMNNHTEMSVAQANAHVEALAAINGKGDEAELNPTAAYAAGGISFVLVCLAMWWLVKYMNRSRQWE